MNRNRFFFLISVLVVILVAAPAARAHANLVRSEPAANSAQKTPPPRARLWFSEEVEPSFSTVSVLDRTGSAVDKGDSHRLSDDAKAMEISLPTLRAGLYTVVWKTLSAVDGHVTNGSFAFTVGDVPIEESSPREVIGLVDDALNADAAPPLFQVIVRGLNILCLALLVGSFTFPLFVLLPALEVTQDNKSLVRVYRAFVVDLFKKPTRAPVQSDGALHAWGARWIRVTQSVFILYAFATVAVLIAQSFAAGDGFASIPRVLMTTRFGMIWLLRAAMLLFLGNEIFRARWEWTRAARSNHPLLFSITLGALLLVTQALNSHGAAMSDPLLIPLIVDVMHLLGVVLWVGGLFQLLATLPTFFSASDASRRAHLVSAVIGCFSLVAFTMVGIIVLTGIYAMVVQVGSLEAFFGTLYGATLFVKFLLMVPLLALGAFNLIVVRAGAFHRQFNLIVALEIGCAVAILFAVGMLTSVAPARSTFKPVSPLWLETQRVDDVTVTLGIVPGLVGTNDFDIKVVDANGRAIADATVVRLLASMRGTDTGIQEVAAANQGKGHYTLRSNLFSVLGAWQVEVLVRRASRDDARTTFAFLTALQRTPETIQPLLAANRELQVGFGLTLIAVMLGTAGTVLIQQRRARLFILAGALGIAILGAGVVYQIIANAPADLLVTPIAPGSARLTRSPIQPDANQLAAGFEVYQQNCLTCHGVTGKGDGPAAVALNPKPFDLNVHAPQHTEGELYWWVTNGIPSTAMVGWETRLTDLQRWQVVGYLRTFGASGPPAR